MQEAWSILQPLLLEIVIPAVAVSAVTAFFLSLAARKLSWKAAEAWIAPLAVAAGLAAGVYQKQEEIPYWSLLPDRESLVPATFCMLLFAAIGEFHRAAGRTFFATLTLTAGALLCAYWLTPVDAPGSRWLWIGILFVAIRLNHHALGGAWDEALGRSGLLLAGLLWGAAAAITLLGFIHVMRYFDLAALIAGSLVGAGLALLFTRSPARGGYAAPSVFFPALFLYANLGSSTAVPHASYLLLGIAPCALLLALPELGSRLSSYSPRTRMFVLLAVLLIPLVAAVLMAAASEWISAEPAAASAAL